MRGALFHNTIAEQAKAIFIRHSWQVHTEYRYRNNGTTTYLDLFAVKADCRIACEVETTARHAVDNAAKALAAGIPLWVIVPSRRLRRQIERNLASSGICGNGKAVKILLLCQLEAEVVDYRKNSFPKE